MSYDNICVTYGFGYGDKDMSNFVDVSGDTYIMILVHGEETPRETISGAKFYPEKGEYYHFSEDPYFKNPYKVIGVSHHIHEKAEGEHHIVVTVEKCQA